jgi:hypothetical protein
VPARFGGDELAPALVGTGRVGTEDALRRATSFVA